MKPNYSTPSFLSDMLHTYKGDYETFDGQIHDMSLLQLQNHIEKAMGDDYKDYETAWIFEYNLIGKGIAQHYFSMKDKKWHVIKTGITNYHSWHHAKQPFRFIAQWLLDVLGYKAAENEKIRKLFPIGRPNET